MYQFKLDKIILKKDKTEYIPNKINIIIGPNNSGKSRFLKEIAEVLSVGKKDRYIIDKIEFKLPKDYNELNQTYDIENKITKVDINGNQHLKVYNNYKNETQYPLYMGSNNINNWISNKYYEYFLEYSALFFSYLGTENRLTMFKQKNILMDGNQIDFMSDLNNKLKIVGPILDKLAEYTKKLFKKDVWYDSISELGVINFKVGNDLESYKNALMSDFDKREELKKENILDDEGDGLKSFISTYLSLKCEDKNILLIDEPEAFLHPPLARQLGEIIGESASDDKQIFVTTHSSEMLKGILSKADDVNIIRIVREENDNIITKLEKEDLEKILKTPKFRVSKILGGLFCEKVVITEAEADEIFYQEFLEKIYPYSGLFFTHVNSKDNIIQTSNMYNCLGVENAMVFDFDLIRKDDSASFKNKLKLLNTDKNKLKEYLDISKEVDEFIEAKAKDNINVDEKTDEYIKKLLEEKGKIYHREGITCLEDKLKEKVNNMLDELEEKNIFVLRSGELETALNEFSINYTENKKYWREQALEFIDTIDKEKKNEIHNKEIVKFIMKLRKKNVI